MNIVISEEGGVSLMKVSGRMDATTAAEFDLAGKELLAGRSSKILINLDGLEFISSAGLRVVLILGKACQADKRGLAFCGLQPMVKEIFAISSFDAIFKIFDDQDAALKNM